MSEVLVCSITQIDWLSRPRKKYGSIVVKFPQKADTNKVLARNLIEVGEESAYVTVWIESQKHNDVSNVNNLGKWVVTAQMWQYVEIV